VEKIFAYRLSEGKYMSVYIDEQVEHITGLEPAKQATGSNKRVLIFSKAKNTDQLLTLNNSMILYQNAQFVLVGM
jgi:hypothetical protein